MSSFSDSYYDGIQLLYGILFQLILLMRIYSVKIKVTQLHRLKYKVPLEKTIKYSQYRLGWTWEGSTNLSLHNLNMSDSIRMTVV